MFGIYFKFNNHQLSNINFKYNGLHFTLHSHFGYVELIFHKLIGDPKIFRRKIIQSQMELIENKFKTFLDLRLNKYRALVKYSSYFWDTI